MLIHTAEGKRSIDEDLVVCIDRHRGESERCTVTVYMLTGEQVTGILEHTMPADDGHRRWLPDSGELLVAVDPLKVPKAQ